MVFGEPYSKYHITYNQFTSAIVQPAYIIEEKERALYFLRNIDVDVNLLVAANYHGDIYLVDSCMINPSKEHIMSLLKKGNLLTF